MGNISLETCKSYKQTRVMHLFIGFENLSGGNIFCILDSG